MYEIIFKFKFIIIIIIEFQGVLLPIKTIWFLCKPHFILSLFKDKSFLKISASQWCKPVISILRRWWKAILSELEASLVNINEFEDSLDYVVIACLKKKFQKERVHIELWNFS